MGKYDPNERTLALEAEIDSDPPLALATLIHGVVSDLLFMNRVDAGQMPELVEMTVVGTGLGMPRNQVGLVGKVGAFWDSTQWGAAPRPFLDFQSLAYANAIAAWSRGEKSPAWANDLPSEIRRPMQGSIKFLFKTNDSFFQPSGERSLLGQDQNAWWKLAASDSPSQVVVALRHLQADGQLRGERLALLIERLRSTNRAIVLHAISATERMAFSDPACITEAAVQELRMLAEHRDEEVRAKAMCALTRLEQLDENATESASMMLESSVRFVVFAGAYALASLDTVPEHVLPMADRVFLRALRACDYEFVALFAAAYNRWLEDPRAHVERLLHDSPEYLQIALEALEQKPESLVSIEQ